MTKLEKFLFFLLIFLIPSNLAYHLTNFQFDNAIIDGILVDYLIPKLFLTDILIIGLLVSWVFTNHKSLIINLRQRFRRSSLKNVSKISLLLFAFFALTALQIPSAANPIAAFWFWLKLLELILFVIWLRHLKPDDLRSTIHTALSLGILWQSLLALAQWFKQASIFPYFVLGESQFTATTPGIAKASFLGSLKVLPLGTTPHPNVLAGYLVISIILIFAVNTNRRKIANRRNISKYVITTFGIITLLLTQSITAIAILILASVIIGFSAKSGKHQRTLPRTIRFLASRVPPGTRLLAYSTILTLILGVMIFTKNTLEESSLSRRSDLMVIAVKIVRQKPLGIGLNNFTAVMKDYGDVEATTRFFQPVHNIYLLLMSEVGLIGFGLVILIFWQLFKNSKFSILHFPFSIPFLMLLAIGMVDHYPLTLQQGQLLTVLSLVLAIPSLKPHHH